MVYFVVVSERDQGAWITEDPYPLRGWERVWSACGTLAEARHELADAQSVQRLAA